MSDEMMRLLLDSQALSIWNHKTGPVFWYAAGVPGPFYLNTEQMIGKTEANQLLQKITDILAAPFDLAQRAEHIRRIVLEAYEINAAYKAIVQALAAKTKEVFSLRSFDAFSGGERRDWLFSIPVAKELEIPHVFLFKNKEFYCAEGISPGSTVLHVADLINNAASYFEAWLPILQRENLTCVGTVCVNARGVVGVNRLIEAGYKVAMLNVVDLPFFERSLNDGWITQETFDELALFFQSNRAWGAKYLTANVELYDVLHLDVKSLERLKSFFDKDPWDIQSGHEKFFAAMRAAIAQREQTG